MGQKVDAANINHHASVPGSEIGFYDGSEGMDRGCINDDVQACKSADGLRNDCVYLVEVGHIAIFDLHGQLKFCRFASQFLVTNWFDATSNHLSTSRSEAFRNGTTDPCGPRDQSYASGKLFHWSSILA